MRIALLASLLLFGMASASAQGPDPPTVGAVEPEAVETTLYLHLLGMQDMPINTQEPDENFTDAGGWGALSNSATCIQDSAGDPDPTRGMLGQEWHRYYGYSSPSFVEYDFQQGGNPRVHPERGFGYDIPLLSDATLTWTMRASNGLNAPADEAPALPAANVRVRAVLRAGDAISVDDKAYDTGEPLFEGVTEPATLAGMNVQGGAPEQVTASQTGEGVVYQFHVPLARLADAIPTTTGFTLRIDVYMDAPGCDPDSGTLMTNSLEPYSDKDHRSTIVLTNGEPLQVDGARVFQVNDSLVLDWQVRSGWGAYDVATADATLRVFGPVEPVPQLESIIQRTREHYHVNDPVRQTWTLPLGDLPDGTYTALFEVPNLQHTATATATVPFTVQDGRLVESLQQAPGIEAGVLLLALALVAFAARRGKP